MLALSGLSWKVATEVIYANPHTDVLSCLQGFMVLQQRYDLNASPFIEICDAMFKEKMGCEMENQTSRGSNNLTSSASSFLEPLASFLIYLALHVKSSIDDLFSGQYCFFKRPSRRGGFSGVVEVRL